MDLVLLALLPVPKVPVLIESPRDALISGDYASRHLRLQLTCQVTAQHHLSKLILLHDGESEFLSLPW